MPDNSSARGALVNTVVGQPSVAASGFNAAAAVLGEAAQTAQLNNLRRDAVTRVEAEGAFRRRMDDELAQLDPLSDSYDSDVETALTTARDDALAATRFTTRDVRAQFEQAVAGQTEAGRLSAQITRRDALAGQARLTRAQEEDAVLARIQADPDGFDDYLAEFERTAAALNTALPPTEIPGLAEQFADKAVVTKAVGLAEANRAGDARAFLDQNAEALSGQQMQAAKRRIRDIESQAQTEVTAAQTEFITDLGVRIHSAAGNPLDPNLESNLAAIEAEIETARASGAFKGRDAQRGALLKGIEAIRQVRAEERRLDADASATLSRGFGFENSAQATRAWRQVVRGMGEDATAGDLIGRAAEFSATSGWIPPDLKRSFATAGLSGDRNRLAEAVQFYDAIRARSPNAVGMEDANELVVAVSSVKTALGIDDAAAAEFVLSRAPDNQGRQFLRQRFTDEEEPGFDPLEDLDDAGFDEVIVTANPEIFDAYNAAVRLYYEELDGNMKAARETAEQLIQGRFQISEVTGEERIMKHQPEKFFRDQNLEQDEVRSIIQTDLEQAVEAHIGTSIPDIDDISGADAAIRLVEDAQTDSEVARGLPPTYRVRVLDTDLGAFIDLGVRYQLPMEDEFFETDAFLERQEEVKKRVEKRLARRRNRNLALPPTRARIPGVPPTAPDLEFE